MSNDTTDTKIDWEEYDEKYINHKIEDIYNTLYLKLKQAIYYEPDLMLQASIAKYETEESRYKSDVLQVIKDIYCGEEKKVEAKLYDWHRDITYSIQPKNISDENPGKKIQNIQNNVHKKLFTNITSSKTYYWNEVNYVFQVPIPLLLLDIWWITSVGVFLDDELGECCYANRIYPGVANPDDNSSHLFKRYIDQYNSWREKAVKTAKEEVERKENVTIISLDFSKYYYSIDIDFKKIHEKIDEIYPERIYHEPLGMGLELFDGKRRKRMEILTKIVEYTQKVCTNIIRTNLKCTHPNISAATLDKPESQTADNKIRFIFEREGDSLYDEPEMNQIRRRIVNNFDERFLIPGNQKKILPIGLFSSKVLSNWYLNDFDKSVLDDVQPLYYGRYVDDTIFVFSRAQHSYWNSQKKLSETDVDDIIDKYLIKHSILQRDNPQNLEETNNKIGEETYSVACGGIPNRRIIVQSSKIKVFQLDGQHSSALIKYLEKRLLKNTHAFTYLPEVPIEDIPDSDQYQLVFEEQVTNKIRGIERLTINPEALSILIAKQAHHLRICGKPDLIDRVFIDSLLNDLKGMRYLDYQRSWDKIFTLLVLSDEPKICIETYFDLYQSIKNMSMLDDKYMENKADLEKRVQEDLITYLDVAMALALSLLSEKHRLKYLPIEKIRADSEDRYVDIPWDSRDKIISFADKFRKADMYRHQHTSYPLLNYIKGYDNDLCGVDVFSPTFQPLFELDMERIRRTPCFIHSHEYQLYYALKYLKEYGELVGVPAHILAKFNNSHTQRMNNPKKEKQDNADNKVKPDISNYLLAALHAHTTQYQLVKSLEKTVTVEEAKLNTKEGKISLYVPKISVCDMSYNKRLKEWESIPKNNKSLRVGIVNLKVDEADLHANLDVTKKQNTSLKRWLEISKLLNLAVAEDCNLVVLPECAIPAQWLHHLTLWSRDHQIGLIFGIEYVSSAKLKDTTLKEDTIAQLYKTTKEAADSETIVDESEPQHKYAEKEDTFRKDKLKGDNYTYNLTAAILPYQVDRLYKSCCVSLRIKNHYSPDEIQELSVYNRLVPKPNPAIYNLYNWHGSQFSVYNCFELADIMHRGIFSGDVDYLAICSMNKDVHYYEDIVNSLVRDIHCYVLHANTAKYGTSRILQPKKKDEREMAIVGGGKNSTLLVGDLNIEAIASFQSKNYEKDGEFKPLPPGFDAKKVIIRHKLE